MQFDFPSKSIISFLFFSFRFFPIANLYCTFVSLYLILCFVISQIPFKYSLYGTTTHPTLP